MQNLFSYSLKFYSYLLRVEYSLTAWISFIFLKLKGTNYKKRLKDIKDINILRGKLDYYNQKRLAIFVAYHSSHKIPQSNINHLSILKESLFEIVYVHNGYLEEKVKNDLKKKGCYVICRENIGQDFGAWKDTILLLEEYKITSNLEWLLLCNDSNFCVGGKNAISFKEKFKKFLSIKNSQFDFICLNCNYEGKEHYQSYFLCLSKVIIRNNKFKHFWKTYIPLNNRYYAIKNGEKKFSQLILHNFKPKIIFSSDQLCLRMKENFIPNYNYISHLLPQNLFFLEACFIFDNSKEKQKINLVITKLINSLEKYNPSHVFGLLNIIFLESPFLKKDIVRMGVFEINQIDKLLNSNQLKITKKLKNEIIKFLINEGNPYKYLKFRRAAVRKGIPVSKNLYEYLPISKELKNIYYSRKKQ